MNNISVALCTFNGEKYIKEQLESIISQTLKPSQIVVCDDQSSDNTIKIIQEVATSYSFFIDVYINEKRLGVTKNFAKAISLCQENYIATSDQDDVWKNNKLQLQYDFFERKENSNMQVVFTDLELVDEQLKPLQKTMWEWLHFIGSRRKKWFKGNQLQVMMQTGNVVTGASLMMKKAFANRSLYFLDLPFRLKLFDEILAFLAIKENGLGQIEIPTVLYRQHGKQVLGTANFTGDKTRTIQTASATIHNTQQTKDLIHILEHNDSKKQELEMLGFNAVQIRYYQHLSKHIQKRINLPSNRIMRVTIILNELIHGRYRNYSKSLLLTPMRDLIK